MALNSLGLGFVFGAKDLASGTIRRLGTNFEKMSGRTGKAALVFKASMATAGAGIGLLVGGLASLGTGLAFANQAGQFDQGLARVGAIARASASEMKLLEERAKQAGIETQFSPTEATEGLRNLAAMGFSSSESVKLLGPALDLAAAGELSIGQASQTAASAMKIFNIETDDAAVSMDKMLRITNLTALRANGLQLALGTVSRGAIGAGQSLDEMLIAMGLVKNAGVETSIAASSVSVALQNMSRNATRFKKIGVEVTDSEGKFRNFIDVVRDVDTRLRADFPDAADRSAAALELFGARGITSFNNVANQIRNGIKDSEGNIIKGAEAVDFLRKTISNAGGAAEEFREKLLDTFEGQKILLRGSLQTLAIELGQSFAKAFKPVVSILFNSTNAVIKLLSAIPEPIKTIAAKAFLLMGAVVSLGGTIAIFIAALPLLIVAAKAIAIGMAIAAGVFLAVGAAVGVVILAFKAYQISTRGASDQTSSLARMWDKLKLAFIGVHALVTGTPISDEVVDDLRKAENAGVLAFIKSVGKMMNNFEQFADGLRLGFESVFGNTKIFDNLFDAFGRLAEALGFGGFDDLADDGSAFIETGLKIGQVVGRIVEISVVGFTKMIDFITFVVENWEQLLGVFLGGIGIWRVAGGLISGTGGKLAKLALKLVSQKSLQKAWQLMTKSGFAVWIKQKALTVAQTIKQGALNTALKTSKMRTAGLGKSMKGLGGKIGGITKSLLGKGGLVLAAGAAGFAIGTWADETFGLSGKLQNLIGDITGLNKEMAELDEQNGGIIRERKSAGFLKPGEGAVPLATFTSATEAARATTDAATSAVTGSASASSVLKPESVEQLKTANAEIAKKMAEEMRKNPPVIEVDGERMANAASRNANRSTQREFGQGAFDT